MMVSIIIINYNTNKLTCDCIKSILEFTSEVKYEIIVVDNASKKEDPIEIKNRFPSIQLIINSENGGFAKGNNLGISHANGDYILLLNSDTILTENSIHKALTKYNSLDKVGILSVKLVYPDGRIQHTARKFRSIKHEILDLLRPFLMLLPYNKRSELMLNQYFNGDKSLFCDWTSGAFMLFKKNLLLLLPNKKLDERFFMYCEDELWCYELNQLGYQTFYYHETSVTHINNGSTDNKKQLYILKIIIKNELEVIKVIFKNPFYIFILNTIFYIKEYLRYLIKISLKYIRINKIR